MKSFIILTSLFNIASVFAANCASPFGQCGGSTWNGVTCCSSGYACKPMNQWYSQCVPSNEVSPSSNANNSNVNNSNVNNSNVNNASNNNKAPTNNASIPQNNNYAPNVQYATSNASASSGVIGYASMNGGTNGGNGGQTITVSNQSQLETALKGNNAKIIKVNGIIKLNADVTVNSNTSLIGANKNSGITGAGLKIKNAKNIIIQNLKFSYCLGSNKDCINAQKSTNIWVDHCEFFNDRNHGKDYYDGLIDFTHASDYITISWNYVHDHYKASLIGHSDSNASEDTGKLHITYHHNYFKNVGSRLPSLRFGTGHVFNNVYENIEASSVNIRMGAKALVEGNVFRNANKPISTNLDSKQEGSVVQRNNDFGSTANSNSITRTDGLTSVPYQYSAENVNNVYNSVVKSAGPQ
ncbi:pectin lyase-like protein [Neocallimastix californiae]|uniref:Pectin lyase-like protein n=1 Tax=Neocallimastix californiae TaxID=1754190 RepID=A0A1Y2AWC4_9FUNG|nr:pectin lyase-like protein [Neocallimastix californiae]|eukprot:ORY26842.1 pectin lyase-like protein [Neocallimastix californiae]